KVCGRALTVFCHIGDNLMIHKAVSIAHPGDVLVVSIRNDTRSGAWGEILTTFARSKGVVGLVIDGAVRDAEATRNRNFPVFSRGLAVGATVKRSLGQINHPVAIGDQIVHPGDLIVGDIDGVVVVPRERAGSVYEASVERERKEEKLMEKISAGATTLDLLGLDSVLDELGLVEE
ncbi:MAG: RraA family protein, partial [Spirochaetota bacterium]